MQGRSYYGQFKAFPLHKEGDCSDIVFCECGDHFADAEKMVRALFYGSICRECENTVKRTRPKPIPLSLSMRKYLKAVEAGEINPFLSFSIRMEEVAEYSQPVKLTPAGNLRKSA